MSSASAQEMCDFFGGQGTRTPKSPRLLPRLLVALHKLAIRSCHWRQHLDNLLTVESVALTPTDQHPSTWQVLCMLPKENRKLQPSYKSSDPWEWPVYEMCWCNRGMKFVGVANRYLIWVKAPVRWNLCPELLGWPRTWDYQEPEISKGKQLPLLW